MCNHLIKCFDLNKCITECGNFVIDMQQNYTCTCTCEQNYPKSTRKVNEAITNVAFLVDFSELLSK